MSTATGMVKVETEIDVPKNALMRVLVVDDNSDVTGSWQRLLEGEGYLVHTAAHPEEALSRLRNEHYDVVVSDILFENSRVTGDQLITENRTLMGQARVVAITAYGRDRVERLNELTEMGVPVLEKGKGDDELERIVEEKLKERVNQVAALAKKSVSTIVDALSDEAIISQTAARSPSATGQAYLLDQISIMLTDWFRSRKNPDKKTIVYAGQTFSANELANEVEKGTQIGVEHLETMVDLFKDCLNLK